MKVILYLIFSQVSVNLSRNHKQVNFSGTEVIEKFQCSKKWDLCVQGVIMVLKAAVFNDQNV